MNSSENGYKLLTQEERQIQIDKLLQVWSDFVQLNDPELDRKDVFINQRTLVEVVERVSKRKYYFEVFHKLSHISEFKEVALYIFWTVKLKPFTVTNEQSKLCASPNELFAVHMVLSVFEKIKNAHNNKAIEQGEKCRISITSPLQQF